jgi:hypothetical protein
MVLIPARVWQARIKSYKNIYVQRENKNNERRKTTTKHKRYTIKKTNPGLSKLSDTLNKSNLVWVKFFSVVCNELTQRPKKWIGSSYEHEPSHQQL